MAQGRLYKKTTSIHRKKCSIFPSLVKIESNCFDTHLVKVESVVENIAKLGMGLSLDKIILFQPLMKYLGFQIKNGVIRKGGKYNLFFEQFNEEHIVHGKIMFQEGNTETTRICELVWFFHPKFNHAIPTLSVLTT